MFGFGKKSKVVEEKADKEFDLDDNLDVDDFDFNMEPAKDDREPITKVKDGLIQGVQTGLEDTAYLGRLVKDMLPEGYGKTMDLSGLLGSKAKDLYEETAREVKPAIKDFKRIAAKIVPHDSKFLPKSIGEVLKEWAEDKDESANQGMSPEQQRESMISTQLGQLFEVQQQNEQAKQERERNEGAADQAVNLLRHRDEMGLLSAIDASTARTDQFQRTLGLNYQKKSIELAYRQLFVMQDMLRLAQTQTQLFAQHLPYITKNTGLPEFLKQSSLEFVKEYNKRKLASVVGDKLFGDGVKFVERMLENARTAVKSKITGFVSEAREAALGMETASDMVKDAPIDPIEAGASEVGKMGVQSLGNRFGKWIKGNVLDKSKFVTAGDGVLTRGVENLPRTLTEFKRQGAVYSGESILSSIQDALVNAFKEIIPEDQQQELTTVGGMDLMAPYHVTHQAEKSLAEVIPGYLARILREIQVFRTNDESIGLTTFDYHSGKFSDKKSILKKIKEMAADESSREDLHRNLNKAASLTGADKLTPEQAEELKKVIALNSIKGVTGSAKNLLKSENFQGPHGKAVEQHLQDFFASADAQTLARFESTHNSAANGIKNPAANLDLMNQLGYRAEIEELGLLKPNSNALDKEKIVQMLLERPGKSTNYKPGYHAPFKPTQAPQEGWIEDRALQAFKDFSFQDLNPFKPKTAQAEPLPGKGYNFNQAFSSEEVRNPSAQKPQGSNSPEPTIHDLSSPPLSPQAPQPIQPTAFASTGSNGTGGKQTLFKDSLFNHLHQVKSWAKSKATQAKQSFHTLQDHPSTKDISQAAAQAFDKAVDFTQGKANQAKKVWAQSWSHPNLFAPFTYTTQPQAPRQEPTMGPVQELYPTQDSTPGVQTPQSKAPEFGSSTDPIKAHYEREINRIREQNAAKSTESKQTDSQAQTFTNHIQTFAQNAQERAQPAFEGMIKWGVKLGQTLQGYGQNLAEVATQAKAIAQEKIQAQTLQKECVEPAFQAQQNAQKEGENQAFSPRFGAEKTSEKSEKTSKNTLAPEPTFSPLGNGAKSPEKGPTSASNAAGDTGTAPSKQSAPGGFTGFGVGQDLMAWIVAQGNKGNALRSWLDKQTSPHVAQARAAVQEHIAAMKAQAPAQSTQSNQNPRIEPTLDAQPQAQSWTQSVKDSVREKAALAQSLGAQGIKDAESWMNKPEIMGKPLEEALASWRDSAQERAQVAQATLKQGIEGGAQKFNAYMQASDETGRSKSDKVRDWTSALFDKIDGINSKLQERLEEVRSARGVESPAAQQASQERVVPVFGSAAIASAQQTTTEQSAAQPSWRERVTPFVARIKDKAQKAGAAGQAYARDAIDEGRRLWREKTAVQEQAQTQEEQNSARTEKSRLSDLAQNLIDAIPESLIGRIRDFGAKAQRMAQGVVGEDPQKPAADASVRARQEHLDSLGGDTNVLELLQKYLPELSKSSTGTQSNTEAIAKLIKAGGLGGGGVAPRKARMGFFGWLRDRPAAVADAYRENGVKGAAGEAVESAFSAVPRAIGAGAVSGGKLFGRTFMGAAKLNGKILGGAFSGAKKFATRVMDVYVEGEEKPRLLAKHLKAGKYMRQSTGKPIYHQNDIDGPITDEMGNVLIEGEELRDVYTKTVANRVMKLAKSSTKLAGQVASGIWDVQKSAWQLSARIAPHVVALPFKAAKMGLNMGKAALNSLDTPVDLYIPGVETPVLLASVMKSGGYISKVSKKVITRPGLIDGPVLDLDGQEVLSLDMLRKGLVGADGKKIKTPLGKIGAAIGATARGMWELHKKAWGLSANIAKGMLKGVKGIAGGLLGGFSIEINGARSVSVLEEIRDILQGAFGAKKKILGDQDGDGVRENSWQDLRRKAKEKAQAQKDKLNLKPSADKASGKVGAAAAGGGLLSTFGGIFEKVGSLVDGIKGLFSMSKGAGSVLSKLGGMLGGVLGIGKSGAGMAATAARGLLAVGSGALSLGAGAATTAAGVAGSALMGTVSAVGGGILAALSSPVILGGLAVAAIGYGGYKLYQHYRDKMETIDKIRLAQYGFKKDDKENFAKVLKLERLLAPLTSFKDGQASLDIGRLKFDDFLDIFGVDKKDSAGLERLVMWFKERFKAVYLTHMSALGTLTGKMELHAVSKLSKEKLAAYVEQVKFEDGPYGSSYLPLNPEKFTPTDATYVKAVVEEVKQELQLDKVKPEGSEKTSSMTTLAKSAAAAGIAVTAPQTGAAGDPDHPNADALTDPSKRTSATNLEALSKGAAATAAVAGAVAAAASVETAVKQLPSTKSALPEEGEPDRPNQDALTDPSKRQTVGQAMAQERTGLKNNNVKTESERSGAVTVPATILSQRDLQAKAKIREKEDEVTQTALTDLSRATLDGVIAIDAIRFKLYGLKEMEVDKVDALRRLERLASKGLGAPGADGSLRMSMDLSELLNSIRGDFGVLDQIGQQTHNLRTWLISRFMPVFNQYALLYMSLSGQKSFVGESSSLKPSIQLKLATQLLGALSRVWNTNTSPWPGYSINQQVESVEENMFFIKDLVQKEVVLEEKRAQNKAAAEREQTAQVDKPAKAVTDNVKPAAQPNGQAGELAGKKLAPVGAGEDGGKIQSGPAASPLPPAPSSPGQIKLAGGQILDGRNGCNVVEIAKGVSLSGMNEQMMSQFYGMAEEYYQLTKKKPIITDAFRSFQDQVEMKKKYPTKAAEPGTSIHEFGLAMDVNPADLDHMDKLGLMRKYGFTRPVGGEPWHMEPIGIQMNLQNYKRDREGAFDAVKAGLTRGGVGLGAMPGTTLRTRNVELSRKIFQASVQPSAPTGADANLPALPATASADNLGKSVDANAQVRAVTQKGRSAADPRRLDNVASAPVGVKASEAMASALPNRGGGEDGGKVAANDIKPLGLMGLKKTASAVSSTRDGDAPQQNNPADPTVKVPRPDGTVEGVKKTVQAAAKMVGVDPNTALAVAAVESDFNPNAGASSSSAKGLFQFTRDTWSDVTSRHGKKYGYFGVPDVFDPVANSIMGMHFLKENEQIIEKKTGQDANATALYATHFMGQAGGPSLLKRAQEEPDQVAAQAFPSAARANPSIFFNGSNQAAPRTVSGVVGDLANRVKTKAQRYGIALDGKHLGTEGGTEIAAASESPKKRRVFENAAMRGSGEGSTVVAQGGAGNASRDAVVAQAAPKRYNAYGEAMEATDGVTGVKRSGMVQASYAPSEGRISTKGVDRTERIGDDPVAASYGFDPRSISQNNQARPVNPVMQLMRGTEELLTQSNSIQTNMLGVLTDIFTLMQERAQAPVAEKPTRLNAALDQGSEKIESSSRIRSGATHQLSNVPVSMRRTA